jgi:serine/threonine protein kinase
MKMCAGLGVHGDHVRAGIGKRLNIFLGFDDHQMDVDRLSCRGTNRFHDQRTNRDVGHETTVHDVDVNPIGACLVDRLDFSLKTAKISGKDRGGDSEGLRRSRHGSSQAPEGQCVNAHPFLDPASPRKRQWNDACREGERAAMTDQRYNLIEKLEAGGMAEVFLGEATSVQGFKKKVAIKRVLPHLASHTSFIGMFLDEARLGARLNHANIVSVFDIGKADNSFFLVMEFVDGTNLKKVIETLRVKRKPFPLKDAIYIGMEACRGLSYAHELLDDDGGPLDLVHRDVSPPNILISRRGEVKVTDFGLAKARTQLERTDPGVVKGKFSYLSPEVASGQPADERADIFALGVCLWEMLAGRRLFLGETDYETVQAVSAAKVPSLVGTHPEVDEQFNAVIQKALARQPKERFQSARELGDALASYLFHHQMKVTSYDIANLVKATLDRQKSVPPQPAMIDTMILEELERFTSLESTAGVPIEANAFALSPDNEGSRPLDASEFVDPSNWFEGDEDVETAIENVRNSAPAGATMGWFETKEDSVRARRPAIPMGPSLNPPPRASRQEGSQPVMTFRPPGATPVSIAAKPEASQPETAAPSQDAQKGGGSKVALIVIGVIVLAAAGVAAGWFFTQ